MALNGEWSWSSGPSIVGYDFDASTGQWTHNGEPLSPGTAIMYGGTYSPTSQGSWTSQTTTSIVEFTLNPDMQDVFLEPRDHAFRADGDKSYCADCPPLSIHKFEESKHIYVIDEEPDQDWLLQLAM